MALPGVLLSPQVYASVSNAIHHNPASFQSQAGTHYSSSFAGTQGTGQWVLQQPGVS